MAQNAISSSTTAVVVDAPVQVFGFEFEELSPHKVTGHLRLTEKCCQPFKKLHGGVSALIAESLASVGAYIASDFSRVAGIQLSINHFNSGSVGDLVFAEAFPIINVGSRIQVWEVRLWKIGGSTDAAADAKSLLSSARVTLLCNIPVPENAKDAEKSIRKLAKL